MNSRIKILVVQDNPEWQEQLNVLLIDHDVRMVSSYWEADRILQSQSFDLAVVDIRLNARDSSNTDGIMLIDDIRTTHPKTGIFVVSASVPPDLMKQLIQKYKIADVFLKNSFVTSSFEKALKNFIQEKQTQELSATIFISYARVDIEVVKVIHKTLKGNKHQPWIDIHSLAGGENWLRSIYKAIDECEIFLAVLSNNSVSRRGVIQKELKKALDKWDGMLPQDIYIVPLRIDDCPIPELLEDIQVIDWADGKGKKKLLDAIRVGITRRTSS